MQQVTKSKKLGNRKSKFNIIKNNLGYYILGLPIFILMIIYNYIPMGGIIIAFKDYMPRRGVFGSEWVGLKWFEQLFTFGDLRQILGNTIIISLMKTLFYFPVPIILAILLNEIMNNKLRRVYQTVIYMPHFLSWVVLSGILFTLLSPQSGLLSIFGMKESIFLKTSAFRWLLVITEIWKDAGWGTIIYLAAISGISPDLYEAAIIDGASRFQRIKYITLPSIISTIIILLILRMGHILNAGFDQIYMLYNANVYSVADVLDTYIFRVGISNGKYSLSTAAGLFKSVVGLILVLTTNAIAKTIDKDSTLF